MSTTAEKLSLLLSTKNDIKAALLEKGQTASDVFSTYADKIRAIATPADGSIPNVEETTYIPGTADQTIAADQYLAGTQTIKGDADLVASNIVSGVEIFGVAGTAGITASDDGAGNVTITMTGVSGISVG